MGAGRFEKTIEVFDRINSEDPNQESFNGIMYPKELLYARRMTEQLSAFHPKASEALQLAARAQHIRRWAIPRNDYPMTRVGYKQWRTALLKYHAETVGEVMEENGYEADAVARVQALIQKKRLKKDKEVQVLEDVICLVFLQYYFDAFAVKHDDEKLIGILKKTWSKMSPEGHEAAMELSLSEPARELIGEALG